MSLQNPDIAKLAHEVASLALEQDLKNSPRLFLENRFWPTLPPAANRTLTRQEEEAILGYGHDGAPL